MKIASTQIAALPEERYCCRVDGKTLQIVIRLGIGITKLSDLDCFPFDSGLHIIILDEMCGVRLQLADAFETADDGDTFLIYSPVSSSYEEALQALSVHLPVALH
jgi:hypothetical protein